MAAGPDRDARHARPGSVADHRRPAEREAPRLQPGVRRVIQAPRGHPADRDLRVAARHGLEYEPQAHALRSPARQEPPTARRDRRRTHRAARRRDAAHLGGQPLARRPAPTPQRSGRCDRRRRDGRHPGDVAAPGSRQRRRSRRRHGRPTRANGRAGCASRGRAPPARQLDRPRSADTPLLATRLPRRDRSRNRQPPRPARPRTREGGADRPARHEPVRLRARGHRPAPAAGGDGPRGGSRGRCRLVRARRRRAWSRAPSHGTHAVLR